MGFRIMDCQILSYRIFRAEVSNIYRVRSRSVSYEKYGYTPISLIERIDWRSYLTISV